MKVCASLEERPFQILLWAGSVTDLGSAAFSNPKAQPGVRISLCVVAQEGLGAPSQVSGSIGNYPFCRCALAFTSVSGNKPGMFCGGKALGCCGELPLEMPGQGSSMHLGTILCKSRSCWLWHPLQELGVTQHAALMFAEVSCQDL